MSTGKVVLGTLAGLAVGAILGILFAPEKGSTTRKQILDKGEDYADELKSQFDEFCDTLTEKFETTKQETEDMVSKGKAKYEDAKKDVKNTAANFKHDEASEIKHSTS